MAVHPYWLRQSEENGWMMPRAAWWKRIPIIRHVRAIVSAIAVSRHNTLWQAAGMIPTGYDEWILHGIWHGMERPQ